MPQKLQAILLAAVVSAAPLGCMTSESVPPQQRPGLEEGVYRQSTYTDPPLGAVAKDIPLYNYENAAPGNAGRGQASPAGAAEDGPPVDTTGIRLGELPSVKNATVSPQHWQRAAGEVEAKIDAPDLKRNVREGMAALAPRVARALIDFKGETAIVTVAVYKDTNSAATTQPAAGPATAPGTPPATQPATQPATEPSYKHAAVAIAFEGFAGHLDPSFIPRVLADQPRTPDDGRDPIDFNLELDRGATSYVFYQLTPDGLVAGKVDHAQLRRELAEAAEEARPSTGPATSAVAPPTAADLAGQYVPVPSGGGIAYDSGEPWVTQRYGGYVYRGPDYYWGSGQDPYLYDLYGCRWGSPYFVTRSGYYYDDFFYGSGFYYGGGGYYGRHHHHRHDDDRGHDRDNRNESNRPPIVISDRSPRGKVPWSNAPIVSTTNPPTSANRPTPLIIPAQRGSTPSGSTTARPAPTITGRPMREPKEFVGPRSLDAADSGSASSGSSPPLIVPSRRPSTPSVAPPRESPPPVAERPRNRGSSASERINNAPRLGPPSNANREFTGPRSISGGGDKSPSNAPAISGNSRGSGGEGGGGGGREGSGGGGGSRSAGGGGGGSGGGGARGGGGESGGGGGGGGGGSKSDGDGGGGRGNR